MIKVKLITDGRERVHNGVVSVKWDGRTGVLRTVDRDGWKTSTTVTDRERVVVESER